MLKNYFKITVRSLLKNKVFTFINICGLAVGLACTLLILFNIQDELSYDKFHKNYDSIYRLVHYYKKSDSYFATLPYRDAELLRNNIADIKYVSASTNNTSLGVKIDDTVIRKKSFFYADTNFLKIFTFNFLYGDSKKQLYEPNTAVVSESFADEYFDGGAALNKILNIKVNDQYYDIKITGVFKNLPKQSSIEADLILPMEFIKSKAKMFSSAANLAFNVYFLSSKNIETEKLEKIMDHKLLHDTEKWSFRKCSLLPFKDIRLYSNHVDALSMNTGSIDNLYVYALLALLILSVAAFNFIILSASKISQKGKEIGVRKLLGAKNRNIKIQIIGEAILTTLLALPLAILLFEFFLPLFNEITGKNMEVLWLENLNFILLIILVSTFIGIVSGLFIAIRYSKLPTTKVIQNQIISVKGNTLLHKSFVITQLIIAAVLIVFSILITRQIDFLDNSNLGFNKELLIVFNPPVYNKEKVDVFKNELLGEQGIINVTSASHIPPSIVEAIDEFKLPDNPEIVVNAERILIDYNYFPTLGINFIYGENYSADFNAETENSIIVNEEFIKEFTIDKNNLTKLTWFKEKTIKGIVKNFNIRGMHNKIPPSVFYLSRRSPGSQIAVRIERENIRETINFIETKWKEFTDKEFNYNFADENFNKLYKPDLNFSKIISTSSFMAVLITCMGLFGLMMQTIEQRTKEIGVRKVLGASTNKIVSFLLTDLFKNFVIATIIAAPIAFYLMHNWLQSFAYKVNISIWDFLITAMILMIVALLTVGVKTFYVASANPVKTLRNE